MTRNLQQSVPSASTQVAAGSKAVRYAIYYTPPSNDPLTKEAEAWLGRSAFVDGTRASTSSFHLQRQDYELVSEPRRYGFHATLKPPFRLAEGKTVEDLERAMKRFCSEHWQCPLGRLEIASVRGFYALVPQEQLPRHKAFAASVVEAFDAFRAPFDAGELRRRLSEGLNDEEATLLVRWGYPYVFDCFRFHMTLTNKVSASEQPSVEEKLQGRFAQMLGADRAVDALTLFEQTEPGDDFVVRAHFPLRSKVHL